MIQARELLPLIYHITQSSHGRVKKLVNQLEAFKNANKDKAEELEKEINSQIGIWQEKIQKLGAHPKGLWLVDFDKGDGYFCWKFPENDILFWHGYQDGFSGRIEIQ